MRTSAYPNPRSWGWQLVGLGLYVSLAVAGLVVVVRAPIVGFPGPVTLATTMIWGVVSLPAGLACIYGLVRTRHRWEWIGSWLLALGSAVYSVLLWAMVPLAGVDAVASACAFTALTCAVLRRGIEIGLVDQAARDRIVESSKGVADG